MESTNEPVQAVLVPLSGTDSRSVAESAKAWSQWLTKHPGRLADVAYSAGALTAHGRVRTAGLVSSDAQAHRWLADVAQNPPERSIPSERLGPLALVFSGQGNQWPAMGRGLLRADLEAARVLHECDDVIQAQAGWSLLEVLAEAAAKDEPPTDPAVLQPTLVALQVAVAAQLTRWGVAVDAYVGHSLGEVSAAITSGVLPLADGLQLARLRGEVMRAATGSGATALLALSADEVRTVIAGWDGALEIAAWNGPSDVLISGNPQAVQDVVAAFQGKGVFARVLPGTTAFHNSSLEPLGDELGRLIGWVDPGPADGCFVSTVTGGILDGQRLDHRYWAENLFRPVRFAQATETLGLLGYRAFIEVGAHPTLSPSIKALTDSTGGRSAVFATLQRNAPDLDSLLDAMSRLFLAGLDPDWSMLAPQRRRPVRPDTPRSARVEVPASWLAPGCETVPLSFRRRPIDRGVESASGLDRASLLAVDLPERTALILGYLHQELAEVLRLPSERLDDQQPLTAFGLDSIMGMELRRRAGSVLQVEVSVARLLRGPRLPELAAELADLVAQNEADLDPGAAAVVDLDDPLAIEDLLTTVDDLSAEEVNSLLARLGTGERSAHGTE
jgi:acyl transferase domain-containing protein/aryl carrier-like protein